MARKVKDLSGQRFGKLVAKSYVFKECGKLTKSKKRIVYWICQCDCGNEKTVQGGHLTSGITKSCGCLVTDTNIKNKSTHQMARTKFYKHWIYMKNRCNCNFRSYENVNYCDRWKNFEHFKEDMYQSYQEHVDANGERNTTLDRIDSGINYSFDNCRWATYEMQSNNKSNIKRYLCNGEYLTITEISKKYNLTFSTLENRLRRNKPLVKKEEIKCLS